MSVSENYRLVYTSDSTLSGSSAEVADILNAMLETARIRNAASEITGALLLTGDKFAQALEGSSAAITETFLRIQADSRHSNVRLMALEPIDDRSFAEWSMAFVGTDVVLADKLVSIVQAADHGDFGSQQVADLVARHLHAPDQ